MTDVIEQLSAADPELGHATDPVRPPAELLASIMDGTDMVLVPSPKRWRRPLVAALAGFAAVLVVGVVTLLAINNSPGGSVGDVISGDPNALITSEMILLDGVVTEEEYRAGAEAVVVCLADAGIESVLDFDNPNGGASFLSPQSEGFPTNKYRDETDRCFEAHLSQNVSLGWMVTLGRLDLEELREQQTAVTACVEERTGEDFGDLSFDEFGYLTEQGQQTKEAAFEYKDHEPWGRCNNDLGYEDEYKAETRALLECVEKRTGEDFGVLDFDASGHPTERGQQTVRAAGAYQNHLPWNACVVELGLSSQNLEH